MKEPQAALADASRIAAAELAQRFSSIRNTTESLCRPLTAEDQMVQSMPDCSPTKWHQAHTTWFFETFILQPYLSGYQPFDPQFQFVFNSYYKRLGGHPIRGRRGLFSRPELERVLAYRRHVDSGMLRFLEQHADFSPDLQYLIELGLNHEQQHQELILTDIKHAFWSQPLQPAYKVATDAMQSGSPASPSGRSRAASSEPEPLRWFEYDEGIYSLGHARSSFAFDNETPHHEVYLRSFQLASRLVTNGEYLDFINDHGYRRPELWLSDGWDTVSSQGWSAPLYWEHDEGRWFLYSLAGLRPLDLSEPACHVSFYEADAFARWAGARLATEAEWEIAAVSVPVDGNLLEAASYHPQPATPSSGTLPSQLFGDVWEWTASAYSPYPGFKPAAGVLGEYNGKFMCNQIVLRGGSCATPRTHIRASYRNFFPAHARWQFSGIRLAKDRP